MKSNRQTESSPSASEGVRGTVICLVLGILGICLGGLMYFAGGEPPQGSGLEQPVRVLGQMALFIGIPLFVGALLVEFFSLRPELRSIAHSSDQLVSLLRDQASGSPLSEKIPPAAV